jgi:hypothetical protein
MTVPFSGYRTWLDYVYVNIPRQSIYIIQTLFKVLMILGIMHNYHRQPINVPSAGAILVNRNT